MILSKIPLATFLLTCIAIYIIVTRYKKERKAVIALFCTGGIGCFFLTIKNLNNIYFKLAKPVLVIVDIIFLTSAIVTIMLVIYIAITKKDKQPYGKLPKLK